MFGMPSTTPYDLRFRAVGIPVRVHPLFWLVMAFLGGMGRTGFTLTEVLVFVGCAFLSVLVHELGHALVARVYGSEPSILLYGMGGLCYYDGGRQTPWRRLAVLACGPGAGFLLAGLAYLTRLALYKRGINPGLVGELILFYLQLINIFWGVLNLLPIYPLDGGQMSGVVLSMFSRSNGKRWGHVISLLTAGILAVACFQYTGDLFLTIFFALFALMNFQILQSMHVQSRYGYGGMDDEADWWRR